jgi:hypothetical protein
MGGLGILNLEIQNSCLLCKCLFKLLNEEGLWREVLKKKYLRGKCLSQVVKRPGDSHFLKGLLNVRYTFLKYGKFKVNAGSGTSFWEDWWIGQKPLKHLFPGLYNLARRKGDSVAKVLSTTPLNISFRRALVGERLSEWLDLVALVVPVTLNENKDKFLWQLRKNGSFSTQALYRESMKSVRTGGKDSFWKAKLPLKIKIFLWYLKRGFY